MLARLGALESIAAMDEYLADLLCS